MATFCVHLLRDVRPLRGSNRDAFDLVEGELVLAPVVELGRLRRLGVGPTVVSPGAIWIIEAAVASAKAMRCKSLKFCDSDTSSGFYGISVLQKSDAKPSTFATSFATSEQGCRLEILGVYRGKLLDWPQMAPGDTTVGSTP